jgi:hypothetical protein
VQLATGHVEAERGGGRLRAVVDSQKRPAGIDSGLLAEGLERQCYPVADFRRR